jgi:hypothetical protein
MAAEALFHRAADSAPVVVVKKRKISAAVVGESDALPLIQAQTEEVDRAPRVFRVETGNASVIEGANSAEADHDAWPSEAADRIIAWEQLEFPRIAEALRALEREAEALWQQERAEALRRIKRLVYMHDLQRQEIEPGV